MTEVQKITLRDILTTAGLTQRQVEDIFLLLRFKPERVQMAFYYRAQGMTLKDVAERIGRGKSQTHEYIKSWCDDIRIYLSGI